ncbi:hypothetical protein P7C71_g195, partial [Lecanoromycetidae sp. Uapishka_2]
MTTAYPPHRLHASKPISVTEALNLVSAYLSATATDPSLHPNALHTDNGPIVPSAGSNTGLVLHNLRRVEAGLRGEQLGPDPITQGFGEEDVGMTEVGMPREERVAGQPDLEMEGEWQDKEQYEREQDVVQGEIGERNNAEGQSRREGGKVPKIRAPREKISAEDRKKAKKERKLNQRQLNAERLKREKDAERRGT